MVNVANVVTAVPGRTIVVGLGTAFGAGPDGVAVALDFGTDGVEVPDVVERDAEVGEAWAVVGFVDDSSSREAAFAGTQAATVTSTSKDPATAGQWRSGERIMRRDRYFHSATPQTLGLRRAGVHRT